MARLATPTAETETTLALIADPHVGVRSEGTSKIFQHTERNLRNAVEDINARDVDVALSVGDLTKDGEDYNYDAVEEILADLEAPFYAVPGNHDVPKAGDRHETMPVTEFADRYSPSGAFPFQLEVDDVDLVGVNTAGSREYLYDSHEGGLGPDADAVRETLAAADDPVVVSHYNLPAMFDQLRAHRDHVEHTMGIPPVTRDGETYVETLADGDTSLLFTGHLHVPATAEQGGVREAMVPTTCSYPQAYLTATVGPDGTTVRFHPVAGREGIRHGYAVRSKDSTTSRGLTAIAADRLARFPLVEE
jgi:DNA repair exonuclease SbcCD nuclease subunit